MGRSALLWAIWFILLHVYRSTLASEREKREDGVDDNDDEDIVKKIEKKQKINRSFSRVSTRDREREDRN